MTFQCSFLSFLLLGQLVLALGVCAVPSCLNVRVRRLLWGCVGGLGISTLALRWHLVGYPPLQNVFEAFLWIPPLLVGSSYLTRLKTQVDASRFDACIGVLFLFPMVFVFSHASKPLMPALQSPFFVPHILGYMLAYTLLIRAFFLLLVARLRVLPLMAMAAHLSFAWGFFFLTLALALGSIWGNEVWGAYWQWDPKEQWSLATWLVYVAVFHVSKQSKLRLVLLGVGILFILVTLMWSNVFPNLLGALGVSTETLEFLFPRGMHAYAR